MGGDWGLMVWGGFVCQDEDSGVAAYAGWNSPFESPKQQQRKENAAESVRRWLPLLMYCRKPILRLFSLRSFPNNSDICTQ